MYQDTNTTSSLVMSFRPEGKTKCERLYYYVAVRAELSIERRCIHTEPGPVTTVTVVAHNVAIELVSNHSHSIRHLTFFTHTLTQKVH